MLRTLKLLALAPLLALTLAAQTYTPKAIRFEGADDQDATQLLNVTGWKPGAPLTRQEIEDGLQKLADTGSFTGISYTVSPAALVVKLEGGAGSQQLPVRFVNFAWWPSDDLEHQLEASVPLFHGELTVTGTLTQQVEATLVSIAKEKGLNISVTAATDSVTGQRTVALMIEHPPIVFGNLKIPEASPAFGATTSTFQQGMNGQEFDQFMTATTVMKDATDIYRNTGYLDATVAVPVFSAPRKTATGYAIDGSAEVHLGDRYHVASLQFNSPPPVAEADLRSAAELKKGDPAAPMGLLITSQKFSRLYADHGYLDAESTTSSTIDNVAHTAAYGVETRPGELYHLASVDASAAPPDVQAELAKDSRLSAGVAADQQVRRAIGDVLARHNLLKAFSLNQRPDRASHTVVLVLVPAPSHTPHN